MEASPHLKPRRGPFSGSRMLQTQPDAVLCRLAMRGNAGAYEALYNRHHGPLYGFVFHLLGRGASAEDAEDIAQESFSTAFSKLATRRDEGSFKSWLFTIARNRTFDQLRAGRPPMADVTELPLAAAGGPEIQAESKAEMAWLMTALSDLPERQREALVMREMGGMSYDEIAGGMKTTVPGVKQLINRARGTLCEAADGDDLRPRRLKRELAALVPVLPLAITSVGVAAFGVATTTAGVAAGAGGLSGATKVAAVALAVAAIGGGAAGLTGSGADGEQVRASAGPSATGAATDHLALGGDKSPEGEDSRGGSDDGSGRGDDDDRGDDSRRTRRRGSARSESDDDSVSREREADDDHSGSTSGSDDDTSETPEAETVDSADDHSGSSGSGSDPEDSGSSGSGSGGESQSASGDDSLQIED